MRHCAALESKRDIGNSPLGPNVSIGSERVKEEWYSFGVHPLMSAGLRKIPVIVVAVRAVSVNGRGTSGWRVLD